MNRWSALVVLLAIAGALVLRAPRLATRPLHNDEAVNAVKVSELWQRGHYVYDPDEYHGPTLHYATLPFLWLSGARNVDDLNDATLRLAPVAFGVGLILLLLLFVDGLGRPALGWTAIFIAISPAMVFYSRYFIHEMLLVFFTALTLGAGWRYVQTRVARWAVVSGAGVGLMFATKETFVITLGAMGLAGIGTAWWTKREIRSPKPEIRIDNTVEETRCATAPEPDRSDLGLRISDFGFQIKHLLAPWNWKHAALAFSAAFLIWLLLFSSFFTNFAGLSDSVRAYLPWLERAGGHSPHIHPWSFYLQRLAWFHPAKSPVWSEGLILVLAAVGAVVSLAGKKSPLHRFLALYTVILTAAYCAIPYKTPWCLLSFFHGMILLAGVGAAALVEFFRARALKVVIVAALVALTLQLTWQAWRASFVYPTDRRNPYVYAQTVPDILNLVQRTEGLARVAPAGHETVVKITAPENDYWPLPWYLRRFKHVGWYEKLPDDPFAPVVVVSPRLDARLDEKSEKKWIMVGLFEMRPGVFFELYVELELWKKYVETLPRDRD
ncbi:MAG: TIGR03663 family protein [Verrucomicrobia bacterium]|nr:TIGR03663 family protein [Verrucomicrobiota bacterium]